MVRVISQETFDSVVKENEDLGMDKQEAVQDAKEQFKAQVSECRPGNRNRNIEKRPNQLNPSMLSYL